MTPAELDAVLTALSRAFARRDLEAMLALFSRRPDTTYAGSESGEVATGAERLRALFSALLGREEAYSFEFQASLQVPVGDAVGVLAEGLGKATGPDGSVEVFAYRLTGILVPEEGNWTWLLLNGSEPSAVSML